MVLFSAVGSTVANVPEKVWSQRVWAANKKITEQGRGQVQLLSCCCVCSYHTAQIWCTKWAGFSSGNAANKINWISLFNFSGYPEHMCNNKSYHTAVNIWLVNKDRPQYDISLYLTSVGKNWLANQLWQEGSMGWLLPTFKSDWPPQLPSQNSEI